MELQSPDALVMAARSLVSAGSVNAVGFAEECLQWAKQRYPEHFLAVAACRLWTAGEEDAARLAPYRVINNALRPTGRKAGGVLPLVMPAVCLLSWGLDYLPPLPEFARRTTTAYRIVPWLFPSPQTHNPHSHFPEGGVISTYDFRAASRSLSIAANKNFSKPKVILLYAWLLFFGRDLADCSGLSDCAV